jgi:hypothetical protein
MNTLATMEPRTVTAMPRRTGLPLARRVATPTAAPAASPGSPAIAHDFSKMPVAAEKVEDPFIRCFRSVIDASQWRYEQIKAAHKDKPYSTATYDSIGSALFQHLDEGIPIACDPANHYFCCATIVAVSVRELPPGVHFMNQYGKSFTEGEEGLLLQGLGEQTVQVRGGDYIIDFQADLALDEEHCCERMA